MWKRLLYWRRLDAEIDEEIHAHLALATMDRLDRGETPAVAERGARRELGNPLLVREATREIWGWVWMEIMINDLRFALRWMRKSPGFTIAVIGALAIGIGATSASFSFADGLLLRPMQVPDRDRVVAVTPANMGAFGANISISYPDYRDFRDGSRSFEGLVAAGFSSFGFKPSATAQPKVIYGVFVSANFFHVLGVQPAPGRAFLDSEDQAVGRDPVVVLGHDLWQRQFGGSPSAIGSSIWLNGVQCTIIGVAPRDTQATIQWVNPSLYIPLAMSPRLGRENTLERRDIRWLMVRGRLKRGIGVAQAQADLGAISARLEQMYPKTNLNQRVNVLSELQLRFRTSPPTVAMLAMLLLLSLCVLLVACANVTGLLLSRARARSREMAVRLAIGASRGALIRQLSLENLVFAILGGAAGMAVAYAGAALFNSIPIPSDLPLVLHVSLDRRVLLFTLAASLLSTFVFGLTPALQTTRVDLVSALKAADADSSGRRLLGRNAIVAGQVALSFILLVVSAVLWLGFRNELTHGPGFRTDRLYLSSFDTQPIHYSEQQSRQFYKNLLDKTRLAPGVQSAALMSDVPLLNSGSVGFVPEGHRLRAGEQPFTVSNFAVSDGYFDTMGIPLLKGRAFLDSDRPDTPLVAVVNDHFAGHYWPKQDAIGKRFHLHTATGPLVQVVGVTQTTQYFFIGEAPSDFIYLPYTQNESSALTIVAESKTPDAGALAPVLRVVVRGLDPDMPVLNERTMRDYFTQRAVKSTDMIVETVASLGMMGLILAVAGLYGLIAYSVSRRSREIGIRMAIGADRQKVTRMVLRQGLILSSIGVGIGLVLSPFIYRALMAAVWTTAGNLSYAILPAIAVPLLLVTLLATYAPARRASLIDPLRALREE